MDFSDSDSEIVVPNQVLELDVEKLKFDDLQHRNIANSTTISVTQSCASDPTSISVLQPLHNHLHSHSANVSDSVMSNVSSINIMPHCRQNLHTDEPSKQADNNKTRRKWTKRNFTNDGKFNTDKKRTGHDLADALYRRGMTLINKAKELHNVTNAPISITIKPLTDRGDVRQYISPNFKEPDQTKVTMKRNRNMKQDNPPDKTETDMEATIHYGFNPDEDDDVHFEKNKACTPKKKITKSGACAYPASPPVQKKPEKDVDQNICQICRLAWASPADNDLGYHWVCCRYCNYWTHANCANIYYEDGIDGQLELEKWAKKHYMCPRHIIEPTGNGQKTINKNGKKRNVLKKRGEILKGMVKKMKKERKNN